MFKHNFEFQKLRLKKLKILSFKFQPQNLWSNGS